MPLAAVAVKCVAIPPPPVLGNDTGMGGAVAVLLVTDPVVSAVLAELPTSASVREITVAVAGIAVVATPEGALVSVGTPGYAGALGLGAVMSGATMIGVARADCGAFGLVIAGSALVWGGMAGITGGAMGAFVAGTAVEFSDIPVTGIEVAGVPVEATGVPIAGIEVAGVPVETTGVPVGGSGVLGTRVMVAGATVAVAGTIVGGPLTAHPPEENVLVFNVVAPLSANARPETVVPVFTAMLVNARRFPTKRVPVPSVAELPTCQYTLQGEAPLIRSTEALLAVVSVLPIWNTNTALASPLASRVSAPVSCAEVAKKYTPGRSVFPPRSCPVRVAVRA